MVVMTHNTDISDTWEREGENQEYFDRFSPDGYAVGVNIIALRMTHSLATRAESEVADQINRCSAPVTEVVEAEGHLIDSQLMNAMFDTVVRHDAAFDVLEFRIGRTNDEPSFVSMRVTAKATGGADRGARGAGVARLPRRARRGRAHRAAPIATAARRRTSTRPPTIRPRSASTASGCRSNASGWTRRSSSTAAAPSAASCARSAPATRSSAASTASRSFPSSRRAIGSASRS